VVAIIAILAAIAVPNFLEAQARSKVARAKADIRTLLMGINTYVIDYNNIFPDNNDKVQTDPARKNMYYSMENPGAPADVIWMNNSSHWMEKFYTKVVFVPLTTPVSYMTSIPLDPFSKVVPMGYDTREYPGSGGPIAYIALFSAGPDRTEGDWYRDINTPKQALPYDPTNGTASRGDLYRTVPIKMADVEKREYPIPCP
jgi:type II secretory pathway pseudopilin PulG